MTERGGSQKSHSQLLRVLAPCAKSPPVMFETPAPLTVPQTSDCIFQLRWNVRVLLYIVLNSLELPIASGQPVPDASVSQTAISARFL